MFLDSNLHSQNQHQPQHLTSVMWAAVRKTRSRPEKAGFAADSVPKPVLSALACMLLATGMGFAEAAPLQLEELLRAAVAEHPSIAARRSDQKAAEMKLEVAERQRYPGLAAQTGTEASGGRSTTFRVTQPLWTGGRITGEIAVAQATINQAEATVVQAQQDIMIRVITAFTELGRVKARQQAARSNVNEHVRLADMIKRRVKGEVSPISDSIQADARLSQARAELNQLEAQGIKARSALAQATGLPVTDIALPAQRNLENRDLDTLIEDALAFSPVLRRLEYEYEAATADIGVRRSSALPQVQMRLDHNRLTTGAKTQMYVALDLQTGAGFSLQASVREAEAKREAIRAQIEVARRDAIDSVSADWADLDSQIRQSKNLSAQVISTTAVFDSFVRQYSVGRKGWNDVLNAQREVAQARFQLADADWGALRSALRVQISTGSLNAEQMVLFPSAQSRLASVITYPIGTTQLTQPKVIEPVPVPPATGSATAVSVRK